MSRESENEKEFLKNLDRLLAGEKSEIDQMMEAESSASIEFAQKLLSLRITPDIKFKTQLKARLLQKIVEQEELNRTQRKRGWFSGFGAHPMVWQAISVVLVMVVIGSVFWGTGVFNPHGRQPVTTPVVSATKTTTTTYATTSTAIPPGPLQANAGTDKTSYQAGDNVRIEVQLTNISANMIKLEKFPPIVSLMQADTLQPVYTFTTESYERVLNPQDTVKFVLLWNQHDAKGNAVSPGVYYLELEDLNNQGQTIKLNLTNPVRFNILPGTTNTGAIERTILLNTSQTASGITITLQRVILTNTGVTVLAFISPPANYSPLSGTDYRAMASYYLDGGWVKDAGLSSVEYLADGMNHTWNIAEPISTDNNELLFVVSSIGSQQGNWEFYIPLK
jgi:hypothetical protein